MFHPRCGRCVVLSNGSKTAARTNPSQEFNRGLVFSFEPLKDNEIFEVKIDKKLNTWSGSIEIGVTVCNPDIIDIPVTATDLKGGTWIMLGQGVFRDGQSLHEAYGCDLDKLVEGDKVGVMRSAMGELFFYVNGECQGIASCNIPPIVYAVVDMYGKCAEVTLTSPSTPDSNTLDDDSVEELSSARDSNLLDPVSALFYMGMGTGAPSLETQLEHQRNTECFPIVVPTRPPLAPTASEEASLTEAPSSALSNHVANIGIANSLLSAQDSNLLRQGESSDIDEAILGSAEGGNSPLFENASLICSNERSEGQQRRQNDVDNMNASERLRFHERAGILVRLSGSGRTAERKRPLDEFNNGVVMSHRALKINELFEIRIDRLVDGWSGSIEVGITTHNPNHLEFPATMTSMRSGTIMMSGTAILTNGKGTLKEYGSFNLDDLKEGDRIGMMIKEERNLYYYINGLEQGIAASDVPSPVWAVVDLYGMTVKVTIVDRDEREEHNLATRHASFVNGAQALANELDVRNDDGNTDALLFHTICGTYAEVINRGRTAHRPNAADDFNNGVVLSHRPLRPNEMFEVQLDKLVDKWAGSLEIGVTTHAPNELEFPSTMTNIRSGTWLMTSNGVTHNGTTIIETYGLNLDRLKVGERIGVCRKDDGTLHFYVDGVDRGVAATNVPERVYGVVDLYGQAAQATICNPTDRLRPTDIAVSSASSSTIYSDLRFHHLHGRNARIIRGGLVAQGPSGDGEFNDAIVMSNRQLHDGEMFEVMIEKMVDGWSGSLEAGMTAIAPEQIDFPSTMTDIDCETWMLSGSSVMRNGVTIMNNYPCDLDSLGVGTRIGMMRHADGTLHYYVNGEDQGAACGNLKTGLWAVIDLYGQCAQVSIVHNPVRLDHSLLSVSQYLDMSRLSLPTGLPSIGTEVLHRCSKCCGANIVLTHNQTMATRVRHFNHGLIFSSHSLEPEELFEVRLEKLNRSFGGSLRIGLTSLSINDSFPSGSLPSSISGIDQADTWWIEGSSVRRNGGVTLRRNYCPDLSRLQSESKVGIKRTSDGTMRLFIDGEDFGPATSNISKQRVFAVIELFGTVESVSVISVSRLSTPVLEGALAPIAVSQDSLELGPLENRNRENAEMRDSTRLSLDNTPVGESNSLQNAIPVPPESLGGGAELVPEVLTRPQGLQFHENRGRNIELSSDKTSAARIESYNQGIVLSSKPIPRGTLFQIRIGALQSRWSSSIMIGVTAQSPDKLTLPNSAFDMKKNTWIICGDSVFFNGVKIKGRYGPNLDSLSGSCGGHLIGVLVDVESRLHLYVNGVDQGVAAKEIPQKPYCVIDLYGQCQEVVISNSSCPETTLSCAAEEECNNHKKNMKNHHPHLPSIHHSHNLHHHLNLQQQQQHITHQVHHLAPNTGTVHRQLNREEQANNEVNATRRQRNLNQGEHISPQAAVNQKEKNKDLSQSGLDATLIKNCEYQNLCSRFKTSLSLPDAYFSVDGNLCFCETCHKIRGDEHFHTKGNPPKQYAQPVGWCRFSLVTAVGENNESWHMAYHGIKGSAIRRMLDKGELLFAGELGVNTRLANRKGKEDASDGSVLYFSPSIAYSSIDDFSPPIAFVDPETKRQISVKLVLQVAVEPGSYKVGPSSFVFDPPTEGGVQPEEGPNSLLDNENIEWVTKERGATQLLALLIRMESK